MRTHRTAFATLQRVCRNAATAKGPEQPTDAQETEMALNPYELARDDPKAMAKLKAQFDRLIVGPMPPVHASHMLPRKVEGQWLAPNEMATTRGDAPTPYIPTSHPPNESEVQGPFARYEPQTAEEERAAMTKASEENTRLGTSGRLYQLHKRCVARSNQRPDKIASEVAEEEIDLLMGAGSRAPTMTADIEAEEVLCQATQDPFSPLWNSFASKKEKDGQAPQWFVSLCRDLHLRTTPTATSNAAKTDDIDEMAFDSEVADPQKLASLPDDRMDYDAPDAVDPYLWLPFNLKSEVEYTVSRYLFPTETTYSTETKLKLSIGGLGSEYLCFCDTYPFADRKQLPTSVGTVYSKLWVRPDDPAPVVYLQLGEHMPPAMWLPIKATATAVRRVLSEFAIVSAQHRDTHHERFEERLSRAENILRNSNLPCGPGDVLRYASYEAKDVDFTVAPIREHPNFQEFFLGEYDDPRELLSFLQSCPFLFAMPHLQQEVDPHEDGSIPTIDGPGVGTAVYRTLYSKSLLFVKVHLSAEVKLPPQDQDSFELLWKDVEGRVIPKTRIPVFVRIIWPDHQRMAGGGKVIERFNKSFNTEFANHMPVDAAMSVFYVMEWAIQMNNFLGIRGMRQRLDELLEAAQQPQPLQLYPSTHGIPNPQYTTDELIGMHIQYLAHLGDPEAPMAIKALVESGSAPVRMGCAKAALEIGDRELFRSIVSSEPPGRMQHYMTKLVISRKTRDLTAKVPKLMEDQYEFGAPLWARGGKLRLDPSTLEGSIDLNRLEKTHRVDKRPREEDPSTDPRFPVVDTHTQSESAAAVSTAPKTQHVTGASRAARFDGRQMPDSFNQKLGDFQQPDEAKDIEDTVSGHVDFDDLPTERKKALFTAVQIFCKKTTDKATQKELEVYQRQAGQLKGFDGVARKSDLMAAYRHLVRAGEVPENYKVEESLIKKRGKSHSGVLVVTVFMGPGKFSCPKDCYYCPNQPGIARSYLLREPGVLRGFRNDWDPIQQFYDRASALENNGHVVDKIELIILGGTFSFYPKDYVQEFITASFYAANTYFASPPFRKMGSLQEEISLNETARCRIIGVTAETRPDYITNSELRRFRELGITRVQLGIQHLDDDILNYINRECPTEKTVVAIQRLLDAGFKVDAHFMPDLPGSSYEKDREMFENLLGPDNELFQVDQWKVYPTATVPFTKIKEWYEQGTYKPYAELDGGKQMVELLLFIMQNCHYRIRLNRIIRDIPTDYIMAGEKRINLRQVIEKRMQEEHIKCHDIRERECKGAPINKDEAKIFIDEFKASGGTEYYISIENPDRTALYGHLRLRLRGNADASNSIFPALEGCAMIRELHTYGKLVAVSHTNTGKEAQHVGVGTQLMRKAEEIAISKGYRRAAVIAGVGVRRYYAKLGYSLADTYMVKELVAPDAVVISDQLEYEDNDNDNERVPMAVVGAMASAAMGKLKSFFN